MKKNCVSIYMCIPLPHSFFWKEMSSPIDSCRRAVHGWVKHTIKFCKSHSLHDCIEYYAFDDMTQTWMPLPSRCRIILQNMYSGKNTIAKVKIGDDLYAFRVDHDAEYVDGRWRINVDVNGRAFAVRAAISTRQVHFSGCDLPTDGGLFDVFGESDADCNTASYSDDVVLSEFGKECMPQTPRHNVLLVNTDLVRRWISKANSFTSISIPKLVPVITWSGNEVAFLTLQIQSSGNPTESLMLGTFFY